MLPCVAVGMWDQTVLILRLSDLSTAQTEKLAGDVISRDVLFTVLGPTETSYLLVALGELLSLSEISVNLGFAQYIFVKRVPKKIESHPFKCFVCCHDSNDVAWSSLKKISQLYVENRKILKKRIQHKVARRQLVCPILRNNKEKHSWLILRIVLIVLNVSHSSVSMLQKKNWV